MKWHDVYIRIILFFKGAQFPVFQEVQKFTGPEVHTVISLEVPQTAICLAIHTEEVPQTAICLAVHKEEVPQTAISLAVHIEEVPQTAICQEVHTDKSQKVQHTVCTVVDPKAELTVHPATSLVVHSAIDQRVLHLVLIGIGLNQSVRKKKAWCPQLEVAASLPGQLAVAQLCKHTVLEVAQV
ncbi:MAG: hypothetical protein KUF82_20850 [Candidatus Thiodiazotropha sp. (ex Ctena orbiculata)]|nr:hypothetical protein [Candidatus Thiodiazotropha taylori]